MNELRNFLMVSVLMFVMALSLPATAEISKKKDHSHSGSGHQKMSYGKSSKTGHKGHHKSGPKWKKTLTDSQKKQAVTMHLNLKKSMSILKAQKKLKKVELINLVIKDDPDTNTIYDKINEIIDLKREMMRINYDHILEMRGMLTSEQRLSFDMEHLSQAGKGKGHGAGGHH